METSKRSITADNAVMCAGTVYVQTRSVTALAMAVAPYIPVQQSGNNGSDGAAGAAGALFG